MKEGGWGGGSWEWKCRVGRWWVGSSGLSGGVWSVCVVVGGGVVGSAG